MTKSKINRRKFVRQSAAAAGAIMAVPFAAKAGFYMDKPAEKIRVALVGCGGRGTGAAAQALHAHPNVQLVSMADAFRDRLDSSLKNIREEIDDSENRIDVPESRKYVGFDAYKKAMKDADVVILTTSPGFRPIHFKEAVAQGKQVFMEKPVATDPAGIASVLETAKEARRKKLNVVVGLQRRYQNSYLELLKRYQDGMIGDITSAQVYWNSRGVWVRERKPSQNEMEYQMRNWYYFNWLCGDHIVEQHIHNMDVVNWFKDDYPHHSQGMGGRTVRVGPEYGEIFDHHFVEYHYKDGVVMNSQCRHQPNTMSRVDEILTGTKGRIHCGAGKIEDLDGNVLFEFDRSKENNPYQTEHDLLFDAISKGEYKFDDTEQGAHSTLTAIVGRLSTYSGQVINQKTALDSGLSIQPEEYAWDATPPVLPGDDGLYPCAVPGETVYFKS
ncbi:Gfo/Idh/MocA family oxidoreductase [Membranicola marinus]|uniref:Gfo/Idh/MocA family oxidoreductase n=1 Tax=Membranihabitans marinus TaxID=1227546 RepID=A0A953HKT5_9BACT|nr:Gfo/Idh/MocA family oxidoreductase [Membranihabitans marinus]MBY5957729.1 Gfo/Idh/MocA family oxidoreductase [Membranihabitans marinus]